MQLEVHFAGNKAGEEILGKDDFRTAMMGSVSSLESEYTTKFIFLAFPSPLTSLCGLVRMISNTCVSCKIYCSIMYVYLYD